MTQPKKGMMLELPGRGMVEIKRVKSPKILCELRKADGTVVSRKWRTLEEFYITMERGRDQIVIHPPKRKVKKKK